jgi:hypothetical protein
MFRTDFHLEGFKGCYLWGKKFKSNMASDWQYRQAFVTRDSHAGVLRHAQFFTFLIRIQCLLTDRTFHIMFHVSLDQSLKAD